MTVSKTATTTPRIIAGAWRGRALVAPVGETTRPTNARARQAAFDILVHAPWAGTGFMQSAHVLDVFAGTGAYGLESLSRGAAFCTFVENFGPAIAAIRANISACKAGDKTRIVTADARKPPPGQPHGLVFLDPPYGQGLIGLSLAAMVAAGWLAPGAIILAELGPGEPLPATDILAERRHGKAHLVFWRYP